MSQLSTLKAAMTLRDVAHILEVTPGMLTYILYKQPKATLYKKFEIPKRYGGTREIWAPDKHLKLIQYRLANLLQDCAEEINALHGHAEDDEHQGIAHGFKRKHTIMTNARAHVTRRYVFNVDLHDFFGSINFGRVHGFFLKNRNFELQPKVATLLAQIACYENKLPQGSPCSPVISNLIGHALDMLLVNLAAGAGCTYTRYADDLTFSSNKRPFPSVLAEPMDENRNEWTPGRVLSRLVIRSGFSFNNKKTRMQYRDSRQEVTGLVVNRKVNVPASYRYTVRAMVDHLFKTGAFEFVYKRLDENGSTIINKKVGQNKQLLGMLAHIDHIDLFNRKLCEKNNRKPTDTPGRITLFRRFLYFDKFYAPSMPIIVCEGATDNVYIKHAVKNLASSYPMLATCEAQPKLKIGFFKYTKRRINEITEITGGVGGLVKLINYYHSDLREKFKAPPAKYPVIILIDNDYGSNKIYGAIAGITKKSKPTGDEAFIHVTGNLYVVPTPKRPDGTPSTIEDFFDKKTLATTLNGKTFHRANNGNNPERHYGKTAFARDVIEKNADSINFSEFAPILDRIKDAIADYAKMHSVNIAP